MWHILQLYVYTTYVTGTQLYLTFDISDIWDWMTANFVKLDDSKGELLIRNP